MVSINVFNTRLANMHISPQKIKQLSSDLLLNNTVTALRFRFIRSLKIRRKSQPKYLYQAYCLRSRYTAQCYLHDINVSVWLVTTGKTLIHVIKSHMIYEKRESAIERHLCSATVSKTRRKAFHENVTASVKTSSRCVKGKLRAFILRMSYDMLF